LPAAFASTEERATCRSRPAADRARTRAAPRRRL